MSASGTSRILRQAAQLGVLRRAWAGRRARSERPWRSCSRRAPGRSDPRSARAARRSASRASWLFSRGDEVLVPGQHLQRPEPEEEDREHGEREEAEDPDAEDELRCQPVRSVDARVARQETPWADRGWAASQRTRPPARLAAARQNRRRDEREDRQREQEVERDRPGQLLDQRRPEPEPARGAGSA